MSLSKYANVWASPGGDMCWKMLFEILFHVATWFSLRDRLNDTGWFLKEKKNHLYFALLFGGLPKLSADISSFWQSSTCGGTPIPSTSPSSRSPPAWASSPRASVRSPSPTSVEKLRGLSLPLPSCPSSLLFGCFYSWSPLLKIMTTAKGPSSVSHFLVSSWVESTFSS